MCSVASWCKAEHYTLQIVTYRNSITVMKKEKMMNMIYRSLKATLFHYTVIGNNRYSVFVQFIGMEIMTVTHAINDTVMIYH